MDLSQQIQLLRGMKVGQLREKYEEVFGEECRSYHQAYLVKRIAWRLQVLSEGDISEKVRRQALKMTCDADIRVNAPKEVLPPIANKPDPSRTIFEFFSTDQETRIPMVGGQVRRVYQEREIIVNVEKDGFRYEDKFYKTLSAIAKEITGTHWNGYAFFRLGGKNAKKKEKSE